MKGTNMVGSAQNRIIPGFKRACSRPFTNRMSNHKQLSGNMNMQAKETGIVLFLTVLLFYTSLSAQTDERTVLLNNKGKLIWKDTREEAFFWGVNYTAPFAHAYRQIEREGRSHKDAMEEDVYHFARLGLNAYRIHVWDCEVSDSLGNLLENEHLDLLDFLIYTLQKRGIHTFLTPIAYWGNGYPEHDEEDLRGFSRYFHKGNVYTEHAAIAAQENYLTQFVNHVNPYTGKAYKDDPMIVGFEVCNEPGHSKAAATEQFVRKMVKAIKATGCSKPIYYNVSQNVSLLDAYINGGTDGITFQWYPTGLVAGHGQKGNFLPHVDKYHMPFENNTLLKGQNRLVYEFDAGDIGQSYMYPPMAISFKEAGMQWVTMFAYDPMAIAASNTEYQTHFLNLAYTPQKAVGLKIAGELFRNSSYRRNRKNETTPFELRGLEIDYRKDLAELTSDALFYYTNHTTTKIRNTALLESIAGYGSSPTVQYNGRGAYFLDKMEEGVWRLEVMPDAVWVRDPFLQATPDIKNVAIKWNNNKMNVQLSDLGRSFYIRGINRGNTYKSFAEDGSFNIEPGVYLLSESRLSEEFRDKRLGNIRVSEFHAPAENLEKMHVVHTPGAVTYENRDFNVRVDFVAPGQEAKELALLLINPGYWKAANRVVEFPMEKTDAFAYRASIPDSLVRTGRLHYAISVKDGEDGEIIYPGAVRGPVKRWDYYNPEVYTVKVLPEASEIQLFHAGSCSGMNTFREGPYLKVRTEPSDVSGKTFLEVSHSGTGSNRKQPEVLYAFDHYIGAQIEGAGRYAGDYTQLKLTGKATGDHPALIKITLIDKDAHAYSAELTLTDREGEYILSLGDFAEDKMLLLPKGYPGFLSPWYRHKESKPLRVGDVEKIQLVVPGEQNGEGLRFELESITLL
ncbi:MAG: membrane or secreted protein [Cytophagales bacterium]|nr:membrane or secreted protein [Cytophagales bacterium]